MLIKVKEFQEVCKSILEAVDTTTSSIVNESLELKNVNGELIMNVTNKEYFVSAKLGVESTEDLVATVDAKLFLTLISKITTDDVEISVENNYLVVKGNGTYKLPFIFIDSDLVELKPIVIDNVTASFNIDSNILLSIINYNSKILNKGQITKPVQKMYYIDEQGAITFTTGACVNSFTLEQPIKILLNGKLVKLFKLFKKDTDVKFELGYDQVGQIVQSKVRFSNDNISITSILLDDNLKVSVPVSAIRGLANNTYEYTINIDKDKLLEVTDRLSLFGQNKSYAKFNFGETSVSISSVKDESVETIDYADSTIDKPYTMALDLDELRATLEGCTEQFLTLYFGNGRAVVVSRANIKNIIPEVKLN